MLLRNLFAPRLPPPPLLDSNWSEKRTAHHPGWTDVSGGCGRVGQYAHSISRAEATWPEMLAFLSDRTEHGEIPGARVPGDDGEVAGITSRVPRGGPMHMLWIFDPNRIL